MQPNSRPENTRELPDWFVTVAEDVLRYCQPDEGLWVDLGSGSGGLGLALARASRSTVLLVGPDGNALSKGLEEARRSGLGGRVVAIVGRANSIPLPDGSVDLVASRGSIFFWGNAPKGLCEVCRVLRPGAKAMIGGGVGTTYPEWAREQFIRERLETIGRAGVEAVRKFEQARSPETFRRLAEAAGLDAFEVISDPPGLWLVFQKGAV